MAGTASARGLLQSGWRSLRAAGPRRLVLTLLMLALALVVARASWGLFALGEAERGLYDLRAWETAPQVPQDQRIQIIAYDDQTLIAARKRSPLDRGILARALARLDGMGARSIGIDMLFDQPQDEDDQLVAALRAMKTPTYLAYAEIDTNRDDITYEQQVFLDSFMKRLDGSRARPASIRLDYADGVARRWPDAPPGLPPLLGRAMLGDAAQPFDGYTGAIRFRRPADPAQPVFSALRIDLFAMPPGDPELEAMLAAQVAGRHVLIGGEIVDVDRVETPFTPFTGEAIPGIRVHAEIIAQMLDGARAPALAPWQLWTIAGLVVLAASLTALIEGSFWRLAPFLLAQLALIGGAPFWLASRGFDTLGLPAVGWALGWLLAFLAVSSAARASGAVERRFAQEALGKYLPRDIAQEIIDHPERLTLSGAKHDLYILFSDLEGFTELSHQLEPEVVARLLNDYLDRLSAVVLEHGGVIDKYVGDAVVAFWGAPIARADDAEKAARAGLALWQAGEDFRRSVAPGLPPIGKTRVGLHHGEAVVGNFGGERRIQYTALGDAMNTASRLESANKSLDSAVIASREFVERAGLDWWRAMGRVKLRGRGKPVDIFEPAPAFPGADRAELARAMSILDNDPQAAAAIIATVAGRHPQDAALQNLARRMRQLGEDNAYVLG